MSDAVSACEGAGACGRVGRFVMGRNWLVICSEALFVVQIVLVTSISHCIMEQPPSHEEESDSDSAVKKFIEAKRDRKSVV